MGFIAEAYRFLLDNIGLLNNEECVYCDNCDPPPYLPWHELKLPKYFSINESPPSYDSLPDFLKISVCEHVAKGSVETADEDSNNDNVNEERKMWGTLYFVGCIVLLIIFITCVVIEHDSKIKI